MSKLRKMLGDIHSQECLDLMQLIETQSEKTLAGWAVGYVKKNYLGIYEAACPGDKRLRQAVSACEEYLAGRRKRSDMKPVLREANRIARDAADNPTAQAAARAVSTACAAVQTPTNALGFLFYGAAAAAYSQMGCMQPEQVYAELASDEFKKAFDALKQMSVLDEPHPAKINWNC
ncbi:putative immunity protein [Candidatus Soleaferrea massiliensis]|uniref:putative immunity protein n=1 Tax=Candidatus Soleaferrea massiliensis TaxID=1470354 RepID=UPI00058C363C|nr:hypothetical protein [Candidatus Soleaferrea massiliensis]